MKISFKDAVLKFGGIVNHEWSLAAAHCVSIHPPSGLSWINSASKQPVKTIYCNKLMADALGRALCNVFERGLGDQLKTFDGCFCVRDVRGLPGHLSCHCYALAIDINAATNQLGTGGNMSPELVKCFTDEGFTWGGTFSRRDPMHFSYGWE